MSWYIVLRLFFLRTVFFLLLFEIVSSQFNSFYSNVLELILVTLTHVKWFLQKKLPFKKNRWFWDVLSTSFCISVYMFLRNPFVVYKRMLIFNKLDIYICEMYFKVSVHINSLTVTITAKNIHEDVIVMRQCF